MDATLDLVRANLLSPMFLAFALGFVARRMKSDLSFPEGMVSGLSTYLLFAIGLKGGGALAKAGFAAVALPAAGTLVLGILTPVLGYLVLRRLAKLSVEDAAAMAAAYGSVSAVTFVAAETLMRALGVEVEGFMPSLVALLEVPAIVVALAIARFRASSGEGDLAHALREVVTGKSIVLLVGGVLIGLACGPSGMDLVASFFVDPFKGVLTLFLLELGTAAAERLDSVKKNGFAIASFGLIAPLVQGTIGVVVGRLVGLSVGGATVLGAMSASASYIAAPAAVRIALPKADPGLYLTSAVGITFPFNLAVGLPIYLAIARALVPESTGALASLLP